MATPFSPFQIQTIKVPQLQFIKKWAIFSPNLFGKYNDNKTAFEIEIKSANEIILFVNQQEIQLLKKETITQFK